MFVRLIELITDERGDAGFDAARPKRNQTEAGVEARPVRLKKREAQVARAINQAEPEDGVVLAEKTIGQPAAEQRKKINADDERVEHVLRRSRAFRLWKVLQQRRDQKHRQDVAHPIKTEPLAALVADNEGDLSWNRRLGRRGSDACGGVAHGLPEREAAAMELKIKG
jgi:hypothetical protein